MCFRLGKLGLSTDLPLGGHEAVGPFLDPQRPSCPFSEMTQDEMSCCVC